MAQNNGTNFFPSSGSVRVGLTDEFGNGMIAEGTAANVPSSAAGYAIGAKYIATDTAAWYTNIGTTSSSNFVLGAGNSQPAVPATIATTGNTDCYIIVPQTGVVSSITFSGVDALATSDTNYITWTVTNLGQAGAGSTALLATSPAGINTTKATGGTAIAANTKYALTLSSTAANLVVTSGDRIRIRAAATGTLANTVTFPTYLVTY